MLLHRNESKIKPTVDTLCNPSSFLFTAAYDCLRNWRLCTANAVQYTVCTACCNPTAQLEVEHYGHISTFSHGGTLHYGIQYDKQTGHWHTGSFPEGSKPSGYFLHKILESARHPSRDPLSSPQKNKTKQNTW